MDENMTPDGLDQPDLWLVDRLMNRLAGTDPDAGAPVDPDEDRLTELVSALRQPATEVELAHEKWYLDAFTTAPARERKAVRTIVIGSRAAVVAGIAVLAAATGAAAYTGSLPGPLQHAAHSVVGAPDDGPGATDAGDGAGDDAGNDPTGEPSDTPTGSPSEGPTGTPTDSPGAAHAVGPDATGPAAFGLCTAWSKGGLSTGSVAYRNLVTAAGGTDGIASYCATVSKPGHPSSHGSPTSHAHGSPTSPGHPSKHVAGPHPSHPSHPSHPAHH
jgi:hypothetical protein